MTAAATAAAPPARVTIERTRTQAISLWLFVTVTILSSIYALFAFLPVTYFKMIRTPMFPALPLVFKFESWIYAGSAIFLIWSWDERLRKSALRVPYIAILAIVCGWLIVRSPYAHVANDGFAASLIVGALLPLLGFLVVAIGKAEYSRFVVLFTKISLVRVLRLAVVASGIYFLTIFLFTWRMTGILAALKLWLPGSVSILCQAGVALGVATILLATAKLEYRIGSRVPMLMLIVSAMIAFIFFHSLLAPLPFAIRLAKLYAGLMGITVALVAVLWTGTQPVVAVRRPRRLSPPAALILIGLFILFYPLALSSNDWNLLLQRICCLVSLYLIAKTLPLHSESSSEAHTIWNRINRVQAFFAVGVVSGALWVASSPPSTRFAETLAQYSHSDISFLLVKDVLPAGKQLECDAFCRYLTANANVEAPMDLPTVEVTKSAAMGEPFNIFLIVIDNLRQDEISPYSAEVDFTPRLQEFARDSTVFRNSFTRYDGTALSELALWSGTSQMHRQFPQPFSRVNTLNKLADGYGYRKYVAWDDILPLVLEDDARFVKLDSHAASWRQLDFCTTWRELIEKHDTGRSNDPVFFYSQPKNVHNVVLAMQETPRVSRSYGTRPIKTSAAIERLDGCFGDFITALKARHMYDNSLIVVTSDHGSAREQGFEGHGLYLRPDDLRVPLIIHLPKSLKDKYVTDTFQVAFVSDITPTLAELLGAKIDAPAELTGRSLFTRTLAEQSAAARPYYMVESSYFPAFGILAENGTQLYVDNAQTRTRAFYDLAIDPAARHNRLTDEIEQRDQARIRREVEALNRWYKVRLPKASFADWWLQ